MTRLRQSDFDDPHRLATLAAAAHVSSEQFRAAFESAVAAETRATHIA
jgi:AraC-like DNA-binding protein